DPRRMVSGYFSLHYDRERNVYGECPQMVEMQYRLPIDNPPPVFIRQMGNPSLPDMHRQRGESASNLESFQLMVENRLSYSTSTRQICMRVWPGRPTESR